MKTQKLLCNIFLITIIAISCGKSKELVSNQPSFLDFESEMKVAHKFIDHQTYLIEKFSSDSTYGYTSENPIKVGGFKDGPLNERRFLNALAGPKGQDVTYNRIGSCCPFETKNSPFGGTGMLDKYSVKIKGQKDDIVLYINMYDADTLKIPVGFTKKTFTYQ